MVRPTRGSTPAGTNMRKIKDAPLSAAASTTDTPSSEEIRLLSPSSMSSNTSSNEGSTASATASTPLSTSTSDALTERESLNPKTGSRPKVLCLGVSYPSMEKQLQGYKVDTGEWLDGRSFSEITVDDVIAAVQDGYLTEMDGRDLARVVATEIAAEVDVYTVSQETAAIYDDKRHLYANFNRHTLIRNLHASFAQDELGNFKNESDDDARKKDKNYNKYQNLKFDDSQYAIRFKQILLDYFWIPEGWNCHHWKPCFFSNILPELVKKRMLDMDDDDNDAESIPCAVYLPFCFFCFRQVINALPHLSKYYAISFLRKADLKEHTLWRGTQTVDPIQMQNELRKQIDQEECYCTVDYNAVKEAGLGPLDEPKEVLMDVLKRLEDFDEIRMIKLRPLRQFHPTKEIPRHLHERGGLVGLVEPNKVKRGIQEDEDSLATETTKIPTTPKATRKRKRAPAVETARKTQNQQSIAPDPARRPRAQRALALPKQDAASCGLPTRSSRSSGKNIKFVALPYYDRSKRVKAAPTSDSPAQSTPSKASGTAKLVTPGSTNTSQETEQQQPELQSPCRELQLNGSDVVMAVPAPDASLINVLDSSDEAQGAQVDSPSIVGAMQPDAPPAVNQEFSGVEPNYTLVDENEPIGHGPAAATEQADDLTPMKTQNPRSERLDDIAQKRESTTEAKSCPLIPKQSRKCKDDSDARLQRRKPQPLSVLVLDAAEDSTKPKNQRHESHHSETEDDDEEEEEEEEEENEDYDSDDCSNGPPDIDPVELYKRLCSLLNNFKNGKSVKAPTAGSNRTGLRGNADSLPFGRGQRASDPYARAQPNDTRCSMENDCEPSTIGIDCYSNNEPGTSVNSFDNSDGSMPHSLVQDMSSLSQQSDDSDLKYQKKNRATPRSNKRMDEKMWVDSKATLHKETPESRLSKHQNSADSSLSGSSYADYSLGHSNEHKSQGVNADVGSKDSPPVRDVFSFDDDANDECEILSPAARVSLR